MNTLELSFVLNWKDFWKSLFDEVAEKGGINTTFSYIIFNVKFIRFPEVGKFHKPDFLLRF